MPLTASTFVHQGGTSCEMKHEDGTLIGTLDVRLTIAMPLLNFDSLDVDRKTRIPILEYLRSIVVALPKLRALAGKEHHDLYVRDSGLSLP